MSLSISLEDRTSSARPQAGANTIAILGLCSGGSTNQIVEADRVETPSAELGDGPLVELGAAVVRNAKVVTVLCKVTGSIAGSLGSVTEDPAGTGPTITVAGTPRDDLDVAVKITKAGALGAARFAVSLDGGRTYGAELDMPSKTAPSITGTVDLTTLTLSDINTLTFIVDPSGAVADTTTFTTPATVAALVAQVTGTGFTASLVQGKYLRVTDSAAGSSSTLAVTTGTANALLGFTDNASATGTDATYEIPNTGITITFPSTSDYVLGTVYTFATTGPRFTTSDLGTALTALRNSGVEFGDVFVAVKPVDGAETRAFANYLKTVAAAWQADTPKRISCFVMPSSIGTLGSYASNDADVKAEMLGHEDPFVTVVHGDAFMVGQNIPGSPRRPLGWAVAIRMAAYRLSSDPGNHEQPPLEDVSLKLGASACRNEETASIKMQTQGFTTAKVGPTGEAFISRGRTRAAAGSKLRHLGVMRMGAYAAREFLSWAARYENADRDLSAAGKIRSADAVAIEEAGRARFEVLLVRPQHASAVRVAVDRDEVIASTDNLPLELTVQHRAQFESVTLTVGVTGTISAT